MAGVLLVVPSLQGCFNGHDRLPGHGDISVGISPRGDALVFNAAGQGGRDLYQLDLKTQRVTRIAETEAYELGPRFSPDSKAVVYAAGKPRDRADHIFVRALDGTEPKQLTAEDADDRSPEYSPDGSLIAFVRCKTYLADAINVQPWTDEVICVMKSDGSNLRELTKRDASARVVHFSSDGKSIYFVGSGGFQKMSLGDDHAIENISDQQSAAGWVVSPDGRFLAYSQGVYSPDSTIFVARADGSEPRQLTHMNRRGCFDPIFTPDGRQIFFFVESWPDGPSGHPKSSLWLVDVDGGNPHEIAGYSLFDDPLHWQPTLANPPKGP